LWGERETISFMVSDFLRFFAKGKNKLADGEGGGGGKGKRKRGENKTKTQNDKINTTKKKKDPSKSERQTNPFFPKPTRRCRPWGIADKQARETVFHLICNYGGRQVGA